MKLSELKRDEVIWILEDDPGSQFIYEEVLGIRYRVKIFGSFAELRNRFLADESQAPHLLLADLRLPDGSFLSFLGSEEASAMIHCPFLIVSSMDDLDVLRACFKEGAMDYLVKPFTRNELLVKVERALTSDEARYKRSMHAQAEKCDQNGNEEVFDAVSLRLKKDDRVFAQLTARELQIFSMLYRNRGRKTPRAKIHERVWGGTNVSAKTLDVHLFNLRRKIAQLEMEIRYIPPDNYVLLCDGMHAKAELS